MILLRRAGLLALAVALPLVLLLALYAAWVAVGQVVGVAHTVGTVRGLAVRAPARILRDERGLVHVRAASLHDAYFAEGYATGSDRLFQIDLTRRFVLGRLSEVFGNATVESDLQARALDAAGIADAEYAHLAPDERDALAAFADGVNAAAQREPTPPEYRLLLGDFETWRPRDALVAGLATVLALTDGWYDVIARDTVVRAAGRDALAAWFSLGDPAYDVPAAGGVPFRLAALPPLDGARVARAAPLRASRRAGFGSNAFAVGGDRSATGRALLASDPHLERGIPGIWYAVDLEAPGLHVAGVTLAGVPGVLLGHNEHVAWGSTNGTVAGPRVFNEQFLSGDGAAYRDGSGVRTATAREELVRVRFGSDVRRRYLRTERGFVLEPNGRVRHAVAWNADRDRSVSGVTAFLRLDRAPDASAALAVLGAFPGPTQNFVVADDGGRVGYALAGRIPRAGGWGLRVEDGATAGSALPMIPAAQLPHAAPRRDAVVVSANQLPYGAGYPDRLSPFFEPPYRAAEIARRLGARPVSIEALRAIQAETMSLAEAELAHACVAALRRTGADRDPAIRRTVAALQTFDGRFASGSRGATAIERIRLVAANDLVRAHLPRDAADAYLNDGPSFATLLRALRERPRGWFPRDDPDAFLVAAVRDTVARFGGDGALTRPYGVADAVVPRHPLAALGVGWWDAPALAGRGGSFAPAVQSRALGQSYRAVWDVGDWDAGGLDLPVGESGEPGSPHYRDLAERWPLHELTPFPFSDRAVARATRATLVLVP